MRTGGSESLSATAAAVPEASDAWFVGGAVRDLLLGIPVDDVDIAVAGDAKRVARAVHKELGGDIFSLSDRFGTWRLHVAGGWQVDITTLRGDTIEEDLALRDFRANAIAVRVGDDGLIDPFDGQADIAVRRFTLVSDRAYTDDPLRPLRLPRLAASLDFSIDPATADATRAHAAAVTDAAPERIFAELRGLVASDAAVRGMALLDELGLTDVVLPELAALKGVDQSIYHHLDAYGHTLEVLEQVIELEVSGYAVLGDSAPELQQLMDRPLADELTAAGALRWAALLHDIAKPETRVEFDGDRVGFPGHDKRGAEIATAILRRLHASERLTQYVAALTRHHLRLGFLVRERPLPPRTVYRYLTRCHPVEVEVGVLSVADRSATRGRKSDEAIAAHLELARELTVDALEFRRNPPRPPLRGDELASALGVKPGPMIGSALAAIAEAQYAGEISGREDAVQLAQKLLEEGALEAPERG